MLRRFNDLMVFAAAVAACFGLSLTTAASAAEENSKRREVSTSVSAGKPPGRLHRRAPASYGAPSDRKSISGWFRSMRGLRALDGDSEREFDRPDRASRRRDREYRRRHRGSNHHRAFRHPRWSRREALPAELRGGFEAWLREGLADGLANTLARPTTGPVWPPDVMTTGSIPISVSGSATPLSIAASFSTTNLQEAGVDESDSVKFDGEFLYIAPARTSAGPCEEESERAVAIRVLRATEDPAQTEEVGEIPIQGISKVEGLYLLGSAEAGDARLLVVGSSYRPSAGGLGCGCPAEFICIDPILPILLPAPIPSPIVSLPIGIPGTGFPPPVPTPGAGGFVPSDPLMGAAIPRIRSTGSTATFVRDQPAPRIPWDWSGSRTTLHLFDVRDPTEVVEEWSVIMDGQLVSSRRLEGRLHVVTRAYPEFPGIEPLQETDGALLRARELVAQAGTGDLLPRVVVNGGEPEPLVSPRRCFLPAADAQAISRSPRLTMITSLDLRRPRRRESLCMGGMAPEIYSSPDALYLTAVQAGATLIHKFAYEGWRAEYRGSGEVEGHLAGLERGFSLGEHDGVLGVVTDLGAFGLREVPELGRYRLTLLRESSVEDFALDEVSHLPNEEQPEAIGKPGDSIHGVRFLGDRLYIVTYRKVDPLYAIDLSDPQAPRIAGQLEIPGFSDYLHPIGSDLLLGVGYDTLPDVRNDWFQGIKVELFDISDPSALESLDAIAVGRRGSRSTALRDHHAVSHLPAGPDGFHRFAVPVQVHDREARPDDRPSTGFPWLHTGLYLFEVEEASGGAAAQLREVGAVIAAEATDEPTISRRSSTGGDRSVIQDTAVHYVHGGQVWSVPWHAPEEVMGPQ